MAIPGPRLLALASRWLDAVTVTRVFEPLIADWQREWLDASPSHRSWIRVRGTLALIIAAMALAPRALLLTPTPRSVARRALSRSIIFTSAVASLLTIPILMEARGMTPLEIAIAALFILPSGIVIAFPFSMLCAADAIRRNRVATPVERTVALRFGLLAVMFMLALVGWGVPAMNQIYREIAAPEWAHPPARGAREATLEELLSKHPPRILERRNPATIQRELHNRAVLALLPAILLWLRFGAHGARRRRRWSPPPVAVETVLAIVVFFTLYFSGFYVELTLGLPPGIAMWLPIPALIMAGVIRRSVSRQVHA